MCGNPRLVQDLRRMNGHRSVLRAWLPNRWRCCCLSCLSRGCHSLVGLTPSTLANDWAIPLLQGDPPEERLVASGLQILQLKVCRQALALLHLLWSEAFIKAYAVSFEQTGCLECRVFGSN